MEFHYTINEGEYTFYPNESHDPDVFPKPRSLPYYFSTGKLTRDNVFRYQGKVRRFPAGETTWTEVNNFVLDFFLNEVRKQKLAAI